MEPRESAPVKRSPIQATLKREAPQGSVLFLLLPLFPSRKRFGPRAAQKSASGGLRQLKEGDSVQQEVRFQGAPELFWDTTFVFVHGVFAYRLCPRKANLGRDTLDSLDILRLRLNCTPCLALRPISPLKGLPGSSDRRGGLANSGVGAVFFGIWGNVHPRLTTPC